MMTALLFPGQGSQYRGMGKELFADYKNECAIANDILGYCIKTLCLEDPDNFLNQTQYTQPALYVVNALHYLRRCESKPKHDYAAGHSLGEYNALLTADVFDFATGLKIVQKRSELMSQVKDGAMAVVIGLPFNRLEQLLQEYQLLTVTIANYNAYRQFVISGPRTDIQKAQTIFQTHTATFMPLSVSGAFHSLYMLNAEQQFETFLSTIEFKTPTVPVIANYTAAIYHPAIIRKNLAKHISNPVQWTKSIEFLLDQGDIEFEEVGSGKVLTGLLNKIKNHE